MVMEDTPNFVDLTIVTEDDNCIESYDLTDASMEMDVKSDMDILFDEFIKKCYSLDNSQGMFTIVTYGFKKTYDVIDKSVKETSQFKKYVQKYINLLEIDQSKKYTHIMNFYKILKSLSNKKRVQLTPISKNITDTMDNIEVTINLETQNNIVSSIEIGENKENDLIIDISKEDTQISKDNTVILNKVPFRTKQNYLINLNQQEHQLIEGSSYLEEQLDEENSHLIPHIEMEFNECNNEENITAIKEIESEIAQCRKAIKELDKEDVTVDSVDSPYLKSDKLKTKVVSLYKKLCELNNEPFRRRKVKLKVLKGHLKGPIKRLKNLLNNNIDTSDTIPFPDFSDVVKCVEGANEADGLCWNRKQVMQEAILIFTHCGHQLQKRRKKREWKDMISKVKRSSAVHKDPADDDPELFARLQANKYIAQRNESNIFQRYAKLEHSIVSKNNQESDIDLKYALPNECSSTNLSFGGDSDVRKDYQSVLQDDIVLEKGCNNLIEDIIATSHTNNSQETNIDEIKSIDNTGLANVVVKDVISMETEVKSNSHIMTQPNNNHETNIRLDKIKPIDNTGLVNVAVKDVISINTKVRSNSHVLNDTISVKTEGEPNSDIIAMLQEFGPNFQTTIIDIQDPFLIIEVSSDSSDDESYED